MEVFFLFKKIFISFITVVLLTSTSSYSSVIAFTPQEEIEQSKIEYDTLDGEILELNSKISTLDAEIGKLTTTLESNNTQIASIENKITSTENLVVQSEEDIKETQELLDGRIRSMYKTNFSTNLIASIITSENIFDMISKVKSIYDIVELDREIMDEIEAKKKTLNDSIESLKLSQENLIALKKSTEESLTQVTEKKNTQTALLDELNAKKDAVFETIENNEKKLVAHPISVIETSNSVSKIKDAINTLNSLMQQLNSSYVIQMCKDAIYSGNIKIDELTKPEVVPPETDNDNSGTDNGNSDSDTDSGNSGSEGVIKTFTMESTAYTGGGLTAMGIKPVRIPGGISTVAVDPNVIPLGSKVHVSGYGYAIAADTGGAVKGNIVDVYLNTYNECISWGRRNVTVKLIGYPGQW